MYLLVVLRFKHLDKSGPKAGAKCRNQTSRRSI